MDNVAEIIQDAKPKIGRTLTAVEDAAQQISQYARTDVADLLADLRAANTEILKITRDFSTVSEQTKQLMLVNRDNIDELIDNMVQVSDNLKATSKDVRRSPWRLLHQPDPKELHSQNIYDAARSFANGAEQLDQAVAKMTNLAKASPQGIPVDDPTLGKIREHLEQTFEKFGKAEQALWQELNGR
jgi:methyl-accepting chemotaxis protein